MENADTQELETKKLTNTQQVITSLFAGAVAGGLAKTTIAPLDRTKIIFQISKDKYSTRKAFQFLINSYKTDGFLSLWRGNSATMARILPYAAIQFTAHDQWKKVLCVDVQGKATDPKIRFLAGALAGVTSQSLTYPLDLARARMAVTKSEENYRSLVEVFVKTWRAGGVREFYSGFSPTVIGVIPYAGMSFFTYGTLKNLYKEKYGETNPVSNLVCGACSGVMGQITSYPLDIVRRRMQTARITGTHYKNIIDALITIYREEGLINGFYKGLSMNWIKGPIAVGISFSSYDYVLMLLRRMLY